VAPGHAAYPAYFVVTFQSTLDDGRTVYLYALITRAAADKSWHMVDFRAVDGPRGGDPPEDPARRLPRPAATNCRPRRRPGDAAQRYADWYNRTMQAGAVVDDPAVALRPGLSDRASILAGTVKNDAGRRDTIFRQYTAAPAQLRPELVPVVEGGVLATFSVTNHLVVFNRPTPQSGPCDRNWVVLNDHPGQVPGGCRRQRDLSDRDDPACAPRPQPRSRSSTTPPETTPPPALRAERVAYITERRLRRRGRLAASP